MSGFCTGREPKEPREPKPKHEVGDAPTGHDWPTTVICHRHLAAAERGRDDLEGGRGGRI